MIGGNFLADMISALATRPHRLSPKYFYDERGSALFDRICEAPEYYPTRTELALLTRHADAIAQLAGPGAEILEFGAGSLRKIRILLDALQQPSRYVPVDISGMHMETAARALQSEYPDLEILPIVADYTDTFELPPIHDARAQRIGFFPGSTLGNFLPEAALAFLRRAREYLRGGSLLLGVDLVKSPCMLHAAYNDAQGITAAFNLNVLDRANRELGADFDLSRFTHSAFYNSGLQRVEMHLMSDRAQQVHLDGRSFSFVEGETLHTENSYKFTIEGLRTLTRAAGFEPGPVWTDPQHQFCVQWLYSPS